MRPDRLSPIYGRFTKTRVERHRSKKKPDLLTPQECREAQRQIRILEAIANNPGITAADIASLLGESPLLIRSALLKFIEDKSLYYVGENDRDPLNQYFIRPVEGL